MRGGWLSSALATEVENLLPPTTPGQQQLGSHTPPFLRPQIGHAMPLLDPGLQQHPLNPSLLPCTSPPASEPTQIPLQEKKSSRPPRQSWCVHSVFPHRPPSLALSDQMNRVRTSWISRTERTHGSVFRELAESKPNECLTKARAPFPAKIDDFLTTLKNNSVISFPTKPLR